MLLVSAQAALPSPARRLISRPLYALKGPSRPARLWPRTPGASPAKDARSLLPDPSRARCPPARDLAPVEEGTGRPTTRWSRPGLPDPVASGRLLTLAWLPVYPLLEAGPEPRARGPGCWLPPAVRRPWRPGGSSRGRWGAALGEGAAVSGPT